MATIIPEFSETVQPGIVIRTDPQVGSSVKVGGQVTVYVATDKQESVKVPQLEGCSKEVAEQLLKAADLEVGTVTEVDSALETGMVVTQSIAKILKYHLEQRLTLQSVMVFQVNLQLILL